MMMWSASSQRLRRRSALHRPNNKQRALAHAGLLWLTQACSGARRPANTKLGTNENSAANDGQQWRHACLRSCLPAKRIPAAAASQDRHSTHARIQPRWPTRGRRQPGQVLYPCPHTLPRPPPAKIGNYSTREDALPRPPPAQIGTRTPPASRPPACHGPPHAGPYVLHVRRLQRCGLARARKVQQHGPVRVRRRRRRRKGSPRLARTTLAWSRTRPALLVRHDYTTIPAPRPSPLLVHNHYPPNSRDALLLHGHLRVSLQG